MKINILTLSTLCIATLLSCNSSSETKEEPLQNPMLALITPEVESVNEYYYVNSSSGLSLRSGTNLKSNKILTLPYGAQVQFISAPQHTEMTIEGVSGQMLEIDYQGAKGFAFNGYLTSLAPPQYDESPEAYAKRVSTPNNTIEVIKIAANKDEAQGMTTSIQLPAKSWNEIYNLSKRLFNLPKSLNPDFTNKTTTVTLINKNKRDRTQIDELAINVTSEGAIDNLTYSYALRDYKRNVVIKKSAHGFTITEEETSL